MKVLGETEWNTRRRTLSLKERLESFQDKFETLLRVLVTELTLLEMADRAEGEMANRWVSIGIGDLECTSLEWEFVQHCKLLLIVHCSSFMYAEEGRGIGTVDIFIGVVRVDGRRGGMRLRVRLGRGVMVEIEESCWSWVDDAREKGRSERAYGLAAMPW